MKNNLLNFKQKKLIYNKLHKNLTSWNSGLMFMNKIETQDFLIMTMDNHKSIKEASLILKIYFKIPKSSIKNIKILEEVITNKKLWNLKKLYSKKT